MTKPYLVELRNAHKLPMRERIEAEVRFAGELERVLGGPELVAETYGAWLEVNEAEASQIDKDTAITAAHWPIAINAALRAGFSKLGDIGEACFEVRLGRVAVASRS